MFHLRQGLHTEELLMNNLKKFYLLLAFILVCLFVLRIVFKYQPEKNTTETVAQSVPVAVKIENLKSQGIQSDLQFEKYTDKIETAEKNKFIVYLKPDFSNLLPYSQKKIKYSLQTKIQKQNSNIEILFK